MNNIIFRVIGLALMLFILACDGGVSVYDTGAQRIALMPYGKFDTVQLNMAKKAIEDFYGYDVKILEHRRLPRTAYYKAKRQYQTEQILAYQKEMRTSEFDKVIGFTSKDIISNEKDEGSSYPVVGKSDRHGPASVISTYRIKRYANSDAQFIRRFKKVVIHEVGHTLGLNHCTKEDYCLMRNYGGNGRILDRLEKKLCENCSVKIGWTDLNNEED